MQSIGADKEIFFTKKHLYLKKYLILFGNTVSCGELWGTCPSQVGVLIAS